MLPFINIPYRQVLREIGFLMCFVAGYFICHLWNGHKEDKKEIRILNTTVATYQSANEVSTKNSDTQQKFQTKMAEQGPKYVQANNGSKSCDIDDAEQRVLNSLIEEANSTIKYSGALSKPPNP